MTVSSTSRITSPFIGTGVLVPTFPFSFKVFVTSDILAAITFNGSQSTLTLTTDYSVALNPDQDASPGGTITLNPLTTRPGITGGILDAAATMVISSQVPQLQSTTLTNFGGFFPAVINAALDRLTILVQQLAVTIGKGLSFPITDPTTLISQLPPASGRASKVMGFDNLGNVLMYDQAGGLTTVDYSTIVQSSYTLSSSDWGNLLNLITNSGNFQLNQPAYPNYLPAGWFTYLWNSSILDNTQNMFFPNGTFYGWKETQATYLAPGDMACVSAVGNGSLSILNITRNNPRIRMTANLTLFVNGSTGSDTNFGLTSGTAFLTIQGAVNAVLKNYDLNGFTLTISVADGTYTTGISLSTSFTGGGSVVVTGNTTTPGNCIISCTNATCVSMSGGSKISMGGFKLQSASSGNLVQLFGAGCEISFNAKMEYGSVAGGWYHILAQYNARINIFANYTISGSAAVHFAATDNGVISITAAITITLTGTPAFSSQFASCSMCSCMELAGVTFSGAATGSRYIAYLNACINTNAGGATYLPGNSAGSTATGGQYV